MDQKITDLDVAISMTASDLIPIVDANGNNKVLHGSQVKDYVADAVVSDIDDVKAMISDEYDPDRVTPYEAGDLVIYNNTLYKCLDTTSGAWDSTKWDDTTIEAEISLKQYSTDNSLDTTDKTVVGAINELKSGKQDNIPNTVAKTVTWDASGYTGDIKAKVYNRVCYISGYFRFSANQSANTQLLHVSDVTLAMDFFESAYTDGSTTVRFKFTTDGKLINENQLPSNQWVSISLACLIA